MEIGGIFNALGSKVTITGRGKRIFNEVRRLNYNACVEDNGIAWNWDKDTMHAY